MADDRVEAAVAQALDICKGDAMDALRMVLVANIFYEEEIRRLKRVIVRLFPATDSEAGISMWATCSPLRSVFRSRSRCSQS